MHGSLLKQRKKEYCLINVTFKFVYKHCGGQVEITKNVNILEVMRLLKGSCMLG